jgi:D-aminoacyl-tRNA deacylase
VRAVVQRVASASVTVAGERIAAIGPGLLVLLGVARDDDEELADRLARKLLALRIFEGENGRMERSVADAGGEILCVSQFTLLGELARGNRPSFAAAAPPERAEPLYERVRGALGARGGRFGARMAVELVNDGPVTLVVEVRDPARADSGL